MSEVKAATTAKSSEPFVRLVKRDNVSKKMGYGVRALALLGALITGAILILAIGHNPLAVYRDMVVGSLGTQSAIKETVRIAIPLLITGLGIALAFKMRFWNIGGEGQIIMGAMAASYFALFQYQNIQGPLLLVVMFLAAAIAGGLWGLIPAIFKSKWDTNETLFTLMLNYIALEIVRYVQYGPWRDPKQRGFPKIAMFNDAARLPTVFGIHIGWIVALVLVFVVYFYLRRSKQGYEISVVGESIPTARYAGMNVSKVFLRTMFISGALCGLTGYFTVAGSNFTLSESVTGGVGFTAITVAWLAKLNPIIMIVVSIFLAMMQKGANAIQTTFKIPLSAAEVLTGLILFFMLGCEFFLNYKLIFRGGKEQGND
ncbi:ABC transporter permease [Christensenellaceae bacterium OttesenSCG-928-M15]|nr:ABC transporter permease [Christensenellaceae bacterium OttesenSCG-928-M15]